MSLSYQDLLKEIIYNLIKNSPLYFCEIVKRAKGAFPTDVINTLDNLIENNLIKKDSFGKYLCNGQGVSVNDFIAEKESGNSSISEQIAKLSDPHPADYDWRFTPNTVEKVTELIKHGAKPQKVALFGTTTVFPALKKHLTSEVYLFNRSRSLINDLKAMGFSDGLIEQDLFKKIDEQFKDFTCVLADPPWYNDFYSAFINQASKVLRQDGILLLSVLPDLTRPSAKEDQEKILEMCNDAGFKKESIISDFFTYSSPKFEALSLKSLGLYCDDWRKGDLYIFRKVMEPVSIKVDIALNEPVWVEFNIESKKIKVKKTRIEQSREFSFKSTDKTKLLSTISRRSPLREKIDFWTSDNYAYSVTNIGVLIFVLTLIELGKTKTEAISNAQIEYNLNTNELSKINELFVEVGI